MKYLPVLFLLAGCAIQIPKAPTMQGRIWNDHLPPFNAIVDQKTNSVLCPKCAQAGISPKWYRDLTGHDMLVWTCRNCQAVWVSRVAFDVPTVP